MACKGICYRYKAEGPLSGGRYKKGQKRCQQCDIFIICEGPYCPCCGGKLRTKPRKKENKQKLKSREEKD